MSAPAMRRLPSADVQAVAFGRQVTRTVRSQWACAIASVAGGIAVTRIGGSDAKGHWDLLHVIAIIAWWPLSSGAGWAWTHWSRGTAETSGALVAVSRGAIPALLAGSGGVASRALGFHELSWVGTTAIAVALPAIAVTVQCGEALRALGHFRVTDRFSVARQTVLAVSVATTASFTTADPDSWSWLAVSWAATWALSAITMLRLLAHASPSASSPGWWSLARSGLGHPLPVMLWPAVAGGAVALTAHRHGLTAAAALAVATGGAELLVQTSSAARIVVFAWPQGEEPMSPTGSPIRRIAAATVSAAVAVVLLAPVAVPLVYGEDLDAAIRPLQLLAITAAATATARMLAADTQRRDPHRITRNYITTAAVAAPLVAVSAHVGVLATAAAIAAGQLLELVLIVRARRPTT